MKRWLLLTIVILLAGLGIGSLAGKDPGYVLVNWTTISIETTVWFFLAFVVVLVVGFYMATRALLALLGSWSWYVGWRDERSSGTARKQTTRGLLALAQGQWPRAERLLTKSAKSADTPLINYLAAARATYEQGKTLETDELLNKANQSTPGAELAVGITQAQLLISRGQNEQALAVLLKLRESHPKHAYVLKLLVKLYQELEDWVALHGLLPAFGKTGKISEEKLHQLENKVYVQLLERAAASPAKESATEILKDEYQKVPRTCRYRQQILLSFAQLLHARDADDAAEAALRQGMKHTWHDDLISLYGNLNVEPEKLFVFASKQLQERPSDPVLLLTLARISLRQEQPEKAKEYLETALAQANMPELHAEMGRVLAATGDSEKACEHFEAALKAQSAH
ncbi:MAG: heme biosynthesis protein HemY [Oceanospirillaceae bacterium]|nr:heme biosynthesis protein HemY [Oceanospirillaceae bacterium]|tara:strand:+ start:702 stop:1898 length:1197 start_codon:yes stop_codon:yes gene_type:complete